MWRIIIVFFYLNSNSYAAKSQSCPELIETLTGFTKAGSPISYDNFEQFFSHAKSMIINLPGHSLLSRSQQEKITEIFDKIRSSEKLTEDQKKDLIQSLDLPRLWIDLGIGFGKSLDHNLSLMRELDEFIDQSWGILLGSSRKSWIDHLCGAPDPLDRLGGSLCSALAGVARGAEIVRVHDVGETVQALEVAKGLALINPID